MAATTKPPYRADHVGSLLRPLELHEARAKARKGEIDAAALKLVEDKCIRHAVALQEAVGIPAVTDGEFRRTYWHIDFLLGFGGVTTAAESFAVKFGGTEEQPPLLQVKQKIRRTKPNMLEHFTYLQGLVTKGTPKFCIPSPAMLHLRSDRAELSRTYPDINEFWADLTQAYREEIADLYKSGLRYLQIDDTSIANLCDEKVRAQTKKLGDDPDKLPKIYADAVNAAIRDVPADMTVTVHTCRGNFKSTWMASGGYDPVAETVFNTIKADGFFLEYDTDRAGGFEPLRFMPRGKKVVLGLVSSKLPALETKADLKRRIEAASKFVPLEDLCLSPQCGFASTHHGNVMSEDHEKKKLGLVIETAKEVWGGL
jgi:5-methyltetrahydropteroyltriglutamate--homocysteine methyltransferase